jgi:predicted DNA-binding WGR domain protein
MSYELQKVADKTHEDFADLTPDYEKRSEVFDRRSNTNKFWRIWVYGCYVVRHHGRHGTKGLWTIHKVWNEWGAQNAAEDLYYKKYNKGYRPEVSVLDRIAREIG